MSMQGLKQFREAIAPFLGDWQSIDLRIMARRRTMIAGTSIPFEQF